MMVEFISNYALGDYVYYNSTGEDIYAVVVCVSFSIDGANEYWIEFSNNSVIHRMKVAGNFLKPI